MPHPSHYALSLRYDELGRREDMHAIVMRGDADGVAVAAAAGMPFDEFDDEARACVCVDPTTRASDALKGGRARDWRNSQCALTRQKGQAFGGGARTEEKSPTSVFHSSSLPSPTSTTLIA